MFLAILCNIWVLIEMGIMGGLDRLGERPNESKLKMGTFLYLLGYPEHFCPKLVAFINN